MVCINDFFFPFLNPEGNEYTRIILLDVIQRLMKKVSCALHIVFTQHLFIVLKFFFEGHEGKA